MFRTSFIVLGYLILGSGSLSAADQAALRGMAMNRTTSTKCAEEDNVNIPLVKAGIRQYRIIATCPTYKYEEDCCVADFTDCPPVLTDGPPAKPDQCTKLFDDGTHVIDVCRMDRWWRKGDMLVSTPGGTIRGHYLRLYRKINDADAWPQYFVLYHDGNARIIPHPSTGTDSVCFGSSVILGPAEPNERPFIEIERVAVVPSSDQIDLFLIYGRGGAAHLTTRVERGKATIDGHVHYPVNQKAPFVTFRSMWVADGNSDVDHVRTTSGEFPIMNWKKLESSSWLFHRKHVSRHNTSAPDIRVDVVR